MKRERVRTTGTIVHCTEGSRQISPQGTAHITLMSGARSAHPSRHKGRRHTSFRPVYMFVIVASPLSAVLQYCIPNLV